MARKGPDMKKRYKGALTVEAAIALPIYIFAMLTLSYMIQSYYIQNTIDAAATTVMQDIGAKLFYLDQLGVIEAGDMIAERTKGTSEKIDAVIEKSKQVVSDVGDVKDSLLSFSLGSAGQNLVSAWKGGSILKILKSLLPFKNELMGQFKGSFQKLKDSKTNVMDIFGKSKEILNDPKGLGLTIASKGVSKGLQYIMSRYILSAIREQMGINADRFRIRSMQLDMGDNGLLYTDSDSGLDRLLTVNIKYKIGIPLFIAPEVELEKTVRKTVRAWIGE